MARPQAKQKPAGDGQQSDENGTVTFDKLTPGDGYTVSAEHDGAVAAFLDCRKG